MCQNHHLRVSRSEQTSAESLDHLLLQISGCDMGKDMGMFPQHTEFTVYYQECSEDFFHSFFPSPHGNPIPGSIIEPYAMSSCESQTLAIRKWRVSCKTVWRSLSVCMFCLVERNKTIRIWMSSVYIPLTVPRHGCFFNVGLSNTDCGKEWALPETPAPGEGETINGVWKPPSGLPEGWGFQLIYLNSYVQWEGRLDC